MNHIDHWSLTPDFSVSDPSDSNFHLFPLRFGSSLFSISQKMHPNDGGKNWQGEARLDGGVLGVGGDLESDISGSPRHRSIVASHRSIFHCTLHLCWHFFWISWIFFGFLDIFWISWHFFWISWQFFWISWQFFWIYRQFFFYFSTKKNWISLYLALPDTAALSPYPDPFFTAPCTFLVLFLDFYFF